MKVRISHDLCAGHGRCYSLAPAVYESDDAGYNARQGEVVDVAPGLEEDARRGVESRPEGALEIVEEEPGGAGG